MNTTAGNILKSMFSLPIELYPAYIDKVKDEAISICSKEDKYLFTCIETLVKETLCYRERDKIKYNVSIYTTIARNLLKNGHLLDYLDLRESLIGALDVMLSASCIEESEKKKDISNSEILPTEGNTMDIHLN